MNDWKENIPNTDIVERLEDETQDCLCEERWEAAAEIQRLRDQVTKLERANASLRSTLAVYEEVNDER